MHMIKLYQFETCPFCEKVRRKLEELEIEYEKVEVDPANKPEIVQNLGGYVPVIEDGETIMNESDNIVAYLEEKYGKSE